MSSGTQSILTFPNGGGPVLPLSLANGGWGISMLPTVTNVSGSVTALAVTTGFIKFFSVGPTSVDLFGIVAPAGAAAERITIYNQNYATFTLHNQSSASSANQLTLANGQNTTLVPIGGLVDFIYESGSSKWVQQNTSTTADYPHNTNILDLTGGTGRVILDLANSLLRANTTNHDPMIDFSGVTQNGYLNFDDSGAQPSIIIFGNVGFGSNYQFRFDPAGNSYIQNDGSGNFNIQNTGGPIQLYTNDHIVLSGLTLSGGDIKPFTSSTYNLGDGSNYWYQIFGNYFQGGVFNGDGSGLSNINYNSIGGVPLQSNGDWNTDMFAQSHSLTFSNLFIDNVGNLRFSGANIQDSGTFQSIDPGSRFLINSTGSVTTIDWTGSFTNAGISFDSGNNVKFAASLYDNSSVKTIDPSSRLLLASDGTTTVIDYSSLVSAQGSLGVKPYVTADLTAQTTAIASILAATSPNDGVSHTHIVGAYLTVTAISVNTITAQVTYTDETNTSRTQSFFSQGVTSAAIATTGSFDFPPMTIRAKNNTSITIKTTTVGAGSQTYDVGGWIQRIN